MHESNSQNCYYASNHQPHASRPLRFTILNPVPFSSVSALGQVISSSSGHDCLVHVYQELEPGLELNFCWLFIEFPLLCFIYAFHHHAESISLLHSPHTLPFVPFLSLCSEVNGSFEEKGGGWGKETPFYFQKEKFQTIFLCGFWMASGKRHFDGTLYCAISACKEIFLNMFWVMCQICWRNVEYLFKNKSNATKMTRKALRVLSTPKSN